VAITDDPHDSAGGINGFDLAQESVQIIKRDVLATVRKNTTNFVEV
jgi:hypothetical protein